MNTTITHSASTTPSRITPAQRERGVTEGQLRICVGLGHPDDLKADPQAGLAAIR